MSDAPAQDNVRLRAHSPGRFPILVVETTPGELRTLYYETGYDLSRSKQVEEEWLHENAVGRHSFIEVDPPKEIAPSELAAYVSERILERP